MTDVTLKFESREAAAQFISWLERKAFPAYVKAGNSSASEVVAKHTPNHIEHNGNTIFLTKQEA